jgi:hypothetical protein
MVVRVLSPERRDSPDAECDDGPSDEEIDRGAISESEEARGSV